MGILPLFFIVRGALEAPEHFWDPKLRLFALGPGEPNSPWGAGLGKVYIKRKNR